MAPKRFLSEKVIFLLFGLQKWKIVSEMRKCAKIILFAPRGKKACKRNAIWLLLEARNAKNEFWRKIPSISRDVYVGGRDPPDGSAAGVPPSLARQKKGPAAMSSSRSSQARPQSRNENSYKGLEPAIKSAIKE